VDLLLVLKVLFLVVFNLLSLVAIEGCVTKVYKILYIFQVKMGCISAVRGRGWVDAP